MTNYKANESLNLLDWRIYSSRVNYKQEKFGGSVTGYISEVIVSRSDTGSDAAAQSAQAKLITDRGIKFDTNGECLAGTMLARRIAWEYLPEGVSIEELFDCCDLIAPYKNLIDFDSELIMPYTDEVFDFLKIDPYLSYNQSDLLIFDRMEIFPRFAGMDMGLEVLCETGKAIGDSVAVIALQACPISREDDCEQNEADADEDFEDDITDLQWTEHIPVDSHLVDIKKGKTALESHYGRIGFRKLPGTELMVFNNVSEQLIIEPKVKSLGVITG